MAKYLYMDGACGISGDMTVAALLDLGASREKLDLALASLKEGGFDYTVSQKASYSIAGCDFDVHLHHHTPQKEEGYQAAHTHEHTHEHSHEHNHEHHTHAHQEHAYHQAHEHRHLSDVMHIIDHATMSDNAKKLAKKTFEIVARAEAKAHGVPLEEVHFHEVGAWDSIADIVGACVLFDDLNIQNCVITALSEGQGSVLCQHGALPVPVPAVLNIAEQYKIALKQTPVDGEMVTPTGIALAAAFRTTDKLPAQYNILKSGIGLGKRDFGRANFLRALIIEEAVAVDQIYAFETNIDDSTPEELGFAMEKLFAEGAFDVHFEPCFMKKNRPAYILRGIAAANILEKIIETLFKHTSTIGVRYYPVDRTCMSRQMGHVFVSGEKIDVKKSTYKNIVRFKPEYESVKTAALKLQKDVRSVAEQAKEAALKESGL